MAQRRRRRTYREDPSSMEYLLDEDQLRPARKRGRRSKKKQDKKSRGLTLVLGLLLLCVAGWIFAGPIVQRYIPSNDPKDLNEWFEVAGDEVKIYFNNAGDNETRALAKDGEAYLPIDWVHQNISSRFYWSPSERMLTYVLPDSVEDYTEESTDSNGRPIFIFDETGEEMYLSCSFIKSMRGDVLSNDFVTEDIAAKRIFIYHGMGNSSEAEAKKDTKLRVNSGIKAEVLTEIEKGDTVTVLDSTENWSRVVTSDGFIGYCQSNKLSDSYEVADATASWQEPLPEYALLDEKVVMSWLAISGAAGNSVFDGYVANTSGHMNVICPTWIQINSASGTYNNYSSKEVVDKAHALGLEVWAVVDNFNDPTGFAEFSTKDHFAVSSTRRDFIERLMVDAELYGYDGINLDFESLPAEAGPSYEQFYRELSVACHERGLTLSIDNYVPYQFNDHYNLYEQGIFADYVVLMGYDEHTNSSESAGSVASIGYTEYGITEALKNVPAEHLINAVPFYTRVWKISDSDQSMSSSAMGMQDAYNYAQQGGFEITWDEESGQYYAERKITGATEMIWLEEERSLGLKLELIREYGLAGVAGWRLGFEPASVWELMDLNT